MRPDVQHLPPPGGTDRIVPGSRRRLLALAAAGIALVLGLLTTVVTTGSASAADNPYQRGPDPTPASVAAVNGPFATASVSVPAGYGFGGGMIYYPTDTSQGTFGGIAISPGYTALFSAELAWMGPWLASHGFVVIGIETNSRNDFDEARGTQLLAALDYLTQQSPVRTRVDPNRLAVSGHSMGGGGALNAAIRRPSLKAAVGLAPFLPSSNLANDRVPTMVFAGQQDTVVSPSYVTNLYNSLPATTESAYLEIAGGDHGFPVGRPNQVMIRTMLPFVKIFLDNDTRYSQFLCPLMDSTGVVTYRSTCPLLPPGLPTTPPTSTSSNPTVGPTTPSTTAPTTTPAPGGACTATYRTTNSWPGGFQGEVTITAGSSAINGWTVRWTLGSGQTISQVWNGEVSITGSTVSVRNAPYNGSLPASGSTTFGFLGGGSPSSPSLTCTSP
ncbi:cellulose binding domain-containing protein [Micromonospora sp. HM5-17]|uniref:poly(ethylene terephthalate) hydrolase family protein n=1 Tax=Micromonospora sp. HM5-17 TaxID=2487710 RepID=UPI001F1DD209|nr:cellulose binding domain-containing protein [Micromonospora sp. HM5-17]